MSMEIAIRGRAGQRIRDGFLSESVKDLPELPILSRPFACPPLRPTCPYRPSRDARSPPST